MSRKFAWALVPIWLTCCAAGMVLLWNYTSREGVAGRPPQFWPSGSVLSRQPGVATLVMIVHPQCPCSRASIGELMQLMARRNPPHADVVFINPGKFDRNWIHTDLWKTAASIPGVHVIEDTGAEARRFGAATSGQTMLYGADGVLQFSGGITAGRGHFGDSAGLAAIEAILAGRPAKFGRTGVFGCSLFNRDSNVPFRIAR